MGKTKTMNEINLFTDYNEVEGNIFAETAIQAIATKSSTTQKERKIEDFGEKIGGARKDMYAAYLDMIEKATGEEIAKLPLSKSFPAPNYKRMIENGIEGWKVDAVRALRDTIPKKPRGYSWTIMEWTKGVRELRDMAISVLEDKWTEEEFSAELQEMLKNEKEYIYGMGTIKDIAEEIENHMVIYQIMGHENDLSALEIAETVKYSYFKHDEPMELREKIGKYGYRVLCYGETKEELIRNYKSNGKPLMKKERKSQTPFRIGHWSNSNYYFICAKVGKQWVEVQSPFENKKEANEYFVSHKEELEEKLEKYKNVPYEREAENAPRTGELKRKDDVTPEEFQETFGFRGVEFGTWVENKNRQEDLNKAYDALMDMAEALNLPPRALSLNGSLGLAFGARGRGGKNAPLAHYEPVKVVINLTKKNGAGSLGHEWLHSVDNYFGKKEKNQVTSMLTNNIKEESQNVSKEVMEGFHLIREVIKNSGMQLRSENLDKHRTTQYWSLPEEMAARAFEVYLREKLKEKGIRNDYLVNYRDNESWESAIKNGYQMEGTYPYPTDEEIEDIKAAYDYLFDSIRFKAHDKEYELYSSSDENIQRMVKESKLILPKELTAEQRAMQKMSEEVFGIDLKYFEGSAELHGRYDEDLDKMYLNGKAETAMEWTFWHEAFHIMKKHEPELYDDILKFVERNEIFSREQIESYRKAIKQPQMDETRVKEEMIADAFADMRTGRRIVEEIGEKEKNLAQKLVKFTKKLMNGVKKFFKAKEVQEKYPEVALTSLQFRDFTKRIEENICSLEYDKEKLAKESKGYKILKAGNILNSPYKYKAERQKKFDVEAAKTLIKKYSKEAVEKMIQELSPLGRKNKKYGREVIQEIKSFSR